MAQHPIESLEELLRALGRERSTRARLRVLGRAWELLRSLSPAERERVALRMGSSWAWKRLEKIFLRDGDLDPNEQLVGQVFERLGDADPKELRRLASLVRNRDREGAQDLLLITLREALEEEADEEVAEPGIPPEPRAAPDVEAVPQTETASALQPDRVAILEQEREAVAELVDTPAGVLASTLARPVEQPEVRPSPPPPPLLAPEPAPEPPRATTVGLLAPPGTLAGAERLRRLRSLERPDAGRGLGRDGRARLVESLGGGWASRRALSRMIAAHALDDLDEALSLVARLARPGQQGWCLADLVAHWPLDDEALERVLAAAPSDAARRRLAHRAERVMGACGPPM